jgi:choline dehydrogenase
MPKIITGGTALGNKGWGYDDVLRYFKRSEHHEAFDGKYHSKQGPLHISFGKYPSKPGRLFVEACMEKGIPYNEDYNGGTQLGCSMLQYTIRNNKTAKHRPGFFKTRLAAPQFKTKDKHVGQSGVD